MTEEADDLDPTGGNLLGIDIAEYFGHDSFDQADRVIFSQLKYSTRNPEVPWTIARVCQGKKNDSRKSIIGRLSSSFKTYLDGYGRELVISKLTIKIVSNRPADAALSYLVGCTKAALRNSPDGLTKHKLRQFFGIEYSDEAPQLIDGLDRLSHASKLQSGELVDFISLLDVSDCGTQSRFFQEQSIILGIDKITRANPNRQFSQLHRAIHVKTLPENRQYNKIVREDILAAFGFGSIDSLLPAPARFDSIEHLIERSQLKSIVKKIMASDVVKVVCMHGGAGFGKSTIARSLSKHLPAGSATVVFDAYGGGTYLDPSDQRHEHEWAILQIANELAIMVGSPLLLLHNERPVVYLRELKQRVEVAIDIVRTVNPSAVVCLVFDAADNSVVAAESAHMRSVVIDLVKEKWPDGFKLVVTARTHRQDQLELPPQHIPIELEAFKVEETRCHLLAHLPDATNKQVSEFHELTHGVPRAQAYALAGQTSMEAILNPLRPGGKQVEDLIQMEIKTAIDRLGDASLVTTLLRLLILLPRPVPIIYVAELANTKVTVLTDLATDLWHGLAYQYGQLYFRDEDYGTYLSDNYPPKEDDYIAIADLFWKKADTDAYASQHLGNFLLSAGKAEQLQQLVLDKDLLQQPADPIQNREVFLQRTRLAMQAALATATDQSTFLKLQMVAAEATKTDNVLKKTLREYPQLTVRYGDVGSIQKLYVEPEENDHSGDDYENGRSPQRHFGSLCYQSAVVYARDPARRQLAEAQLKQADAWRQWVRGRPEGSRKGFFDILDIIAGLEAYVVLRGVSDAVRWFRTWKTGEYKASILRNLAENLLIHYPYSQVQIWLAEITLRAGAALIVWDALRTYGKQDWPPIPAIVKPLQRLSMKKRELSTHIQRAGLSLCESLTRKGNSSGTVLHLLDLFQPSKPEVKTFYFNETPEQQSQVILNLYVRGEVLRSALMETALEIRHFYPEELQAHLAKQDKEKKDKYENDRLIDQKRRYDHLYPHILTFFQIRAHFLTGIINEQQFNVGFSEAANKLKADWEIRHYRRMEFGHYMTFLAYAILDVIPQYSKPGELVGQLLDIFLEKPQNAIRLRLVMSDRLTTNPATRPLALPLLDEVTDWLNDGHEVGETRIDSFAEITLIGQRIDYTIGKACFDRLIDAASHIDVDAHEQLLCLERLASQGIPQPNPELTHAFGRYAEYCYEQLRGYDHFPWASIVATLSLLDHSSALAQLCRWDHRNVLPFTDQLVTALIIGLEKGWLPHTTVSGLLPLLGNYYDRVDELLASLVERYDQQGDAPQKVRFVEDMLYDLSTRYRGDASHKIINRLSDLPGGTYLNANIRRRLKHYFQTVLDQYSKRSESNYQYESPRPNDEEEGSPQWRELAQTVDPFSTASLEEAIRQLTKKKFNFFYHKEGKAFWELLTQRCSPGQYAEHLTAFALIDTKLLPVNHFLDLLEVPLLAWRTLPTVIQWKSDNAEKVFEHWFLAFRNFGSLQHNYMYALGRLLDLSEAELSKLVSRIIPGFIHQLKANDLYELVEYTRLPLLGSEIEALLTWTLDRWNQAVPAEMGDGPWQERFRLSGNKDEAVADVLRYLMGHPARNLRGRAAHALRRLSDYGQREVLRHLVEKTNKRHCTPFQHPTYTFYWLSAKLWLWATIDRLAIDAPQTVRRFLPQMLTELDQEQGHALIQFFIRRTALRLLQNDPSAFTASNRQLVENTLTSHLLPVEDSTSVKRNAVVDEPDRELAFYFDPIDTLPYWYNSLGRLFGVSSHEVAQLADEVIRDELGFVGDARQENHVRSEEYYSTSNKHGELPEVEDLRSYYEYHAMFYAAGRLLKILPLIAREEYDDSFDDWLAQWSTYWPDIWQADLRDPPPNNEPVNNSRSIDPLDEWLAVDLADLAKRIVFRESNEVDEGITVYAGWSNDFDNASENLTLRSAMVSAKTAPALLRALYMVSDYYNYAVPTEDSEHEYDVPGFTFTGFVKLVYSENYRALEKHDDFANDLPSHFVQLGDAFTAWSGGVLSADFRLTKTNQSTIAHFENWSNVHKSRHQQVGGAGMRFSVNRDILCRYLAAHDFCLLIECHIKRESKPRDDSSGEHQPTKPTLFLLHADGTISTPTA